MQHKHENLFPRLFPYVPAETLEPPRWMVRAIFIPYQEGTDVSCTCSDLHDPALLMNKAEEAGNTERDIEHSMCVYVHIYTYIDNMFHLCRFWGLFF